MPKRKQVVRKSRARRAKQVTISIDADLYDAILPVLAARETNFSTVVGVYLKAFQNVTVKKTDLELRDKMPSGKYSGATVGDVVRTDPAYMLWLVRNDKMVSFADDVLDLLHDR